MAKAYKQEVSSPLGTLTLASDGEVLAGLWIEGQRYFAPGFELEEAALPIFDRTRAWLDCYFSGGRPEIGSLSLSPRGTPFQNRVWQALCQIPYGAVLTYGALAGQLNSSPRAIGAAVGRNPISIIIPCHRVLGADGSLTGYAGGLARKEWLLRLEGAL